MFCSTASCVFSLLGCWGEGVVPSVAYSLVLSALSCAQRHLKNRAAMFCNSLLCFHLVASSIVFPPSEIGIVLRLFM